MTQDMSLKKWDYTGLLKREMALYVKLQKQFDIQLFSYGDVGDLFYESLYPGIKILIIPYYKNNLSIKNRIHLYSALKKLKKSSIIKTNQILGSHEAMYYAKEWAIPLVVRCGYLHSTFIKRQSTNAEEIQEASKYEAAAFQNATASIVTSPRDREYVIQNYDLNPLNVHVIPNYVDQEVFKPTNSKREQGHVLYVGRFSEQKNLNMLLEAVELSKMTKKLTLIGSGPLKNELEKRAQSITKKEIQFINSLPNNDLTKFYQSCEAYVLPSLYEGLPKTLLEAMSCGCTCLGTNVEGIREVIDGTNGELADVNVDDLAMKLDQLLSNSDKRDSYGREAHHFITKRFGLDLAVGLETEIYNQLMLDYAS